MSCFHVGFPTQTSSNDKFIFSLNRDQWVNLTLSRGSLGGISLEPDYGVHLTAPIQPTGCDMQTQLWGCT